MHLNRFSIQNYKCFNEPAELVLKPGINLVVGKNNSGKTALLQALSMNAEAVPHRSYGGNGEVLGTGNVAASEFDFWVTANELAQYSSQAVPVTAAGLPVPLPSPDSDLAKEIEYTDNSPESLTRFSKWLKTAELRISLQLNGATLAGVSLSGPGGYDSVGPRASLGVRAALAHTANSITPAVPFQTALPQYGEFLKGRFRFIQASRGMGLQPGIGQKMDRLAADGNNVVGLLDTIQRNGNKLDRFVELFQEVFPAVRHLSVRTVGGNNGEIAIWEHGRETELEELPPSLQRSGSGVLHTLIMLLMAFCEHDPMIILIDEFEHSLHPGAVRKLLEIFERNFSRHQFIIGTHSPTAIASARPTTVSVVKKREGQSTLQSIDRSGLKYRRQLLAEIGASVSDLFGADSVLWVEGATEEIIFPQIYERLAKPAEFGATVFKGVIHTGDLERKRDADKVLQIYDKLSGADALFPTQVCFVLDDEGRTQAQKKELAHRCGGRIRFTKRRMFENYLIHQGAIAAVLSAIDGMEEISAEQIANWLTAHRYDANYGAAAAGAEWQTVIHGGNLLKNLFSEVSQQKVTYEKTTHSIAIADWLLDNDKATLQEIADLLQDARKVVDERLPDKQAAETGN